MFSLLAQDAIQSVKALFALIGFDIRLVSLVFILIIVFVLDLNALLDTDSSPFRTPLRHGSARLHRPYWSGIGERWRRSLPSGLDHASHHVCCFTPVL